MKKIHPHVASGQSRVWRLRSALLTLALLLTGAALSAPALAAPLHSVAPFSPITGAGIGDPFAFPESVAVDESSGNILVVSGKFGECATCTDNAVDILGTEGGTPAGVASPYKLPLTEVIGGVEGVGAAVDNSSSPSKGTLYVPGGTDPAAELRFERVSKYVRNPSTEQYVAAGELIPVPPLVAEATSVAVDDQGNVYVAYEHGGTTPPGGKFGPPGLIVKFSPTGVQLEQIEMTEETRRPQGLALDSAGDLFVAEPQNDFKSFKFPINGLGKLDANNFVEVPQSVSQPVSVGVDRASNTLFVVNSTEVAEFDATTLVEKGAFTGPAPHSRRLVVNSAAGYIYMAASFERTIGVLTLNGPTLADAGTTPPTEVSVTKATLHGKVDPHGLAVSECKFVGSSIGSVPCEGAIPTDNAVHDVAAHVSGLAPGSRPSYRLVVTNANGTNQSAEKAFDTAPVGETTAATALTSTSATLNGLVRPEGTPVGECKFEFGPTTAYGTTLPCSPEAGAIPTDFAGHTVSAGVSGLEVGATYHYRLAASTGLGSEVGKDVVFTALGPSVESISFGGLAETAVTLEARINPRGMATSYHFEYGSQGSCSANPCASAPVPDAEAGSGGSSVNVSQRVQGLSPNTTYHFRVVASNPAGVRQSSESTFTTYSVPPSFEACPNDSFRLGRPSAHLPDCRAYEQASPIVKNGNDIGGNLYNVQASLSGDAITSLVKGGIPGGEGEETYPLYVSRRSGASWLTRGMLPPPTFGDEAVIQNWTPDLKHFLLISALADQSGLAPERAFFLRDAEGGAIQQITPYLRGARYAFVGASGDGTKFFFETAGAGINLTGNAATGKDNLYLYDTSTEEVSLVGLLPNETAPPGGSFAGPYNWNGNVNTANRLATGGAIPTESHVPGENAYLTQELHTISADGSKAFFTAGLTGQLYMREGIGGEESRTVQLSASRRTTPDPGGTKPAIFMDATPSGSFVFFTSCQKLTDDSTAHSTSAGECQLPGQGQDLYAYDTENQELSDLTVDGNGADPDGADVQGVVGSSDDGSYVYFVANGDLDGAGPAQAGNCQHLEGGLTEYSGTCNLYVWHAGSVSFVAPMDTEGGQFTNDVFNWFAGGPHLAGSLASGHVSDDGQTVVFSSQQPLTGYDSTQSGGECEGGGKGHGGCREFFRYRYGDPTLSCISCNPTGAAPVVGRPNLQTIRQGIAGNSVPRSVRFTSASGNQVFFETPEKLVGADTNGDNGCPRVARPDAPIPTCLDVYEWEAAGAGSCKATSSAFSPINSGCIYLLSSGTSPDPSFLADASASGNDVYIFTGDQLVPSDKDHLFDLYDVSVGGGLASQNQPPPPPPCEGEACRGAGSAPPNGVSAGSASFRGPGDPAIKRCPKGKVARGSRCVKPRKPRKHHKHHKHHKGHGGPAKKRAGAEQGGGK